MDINDFFKRIFGFDRMQRRPQSAEEFFGGPDEDDDGSEVKVFFNFDIFDMNKQMESMAREMENMFKDFGAVEFFPGIEHRETELPQNPRDEMLKDKDNDSKPTFVHPHQHWSPFGGPFSSRKPIQEKKEDRDVDGKLDVDDVARLFEKPSAEPIIRRRSVIESRVGGSDGKMEHKRTVKNEDGSSEVTITRSKGDQSHTVIIKTDKSGAEEKTENFKNIDEGEISNFNRSWNSPQQPALPFSRRNDLLKDNDIIKDNTDATLYNKFFGNSTPSQPKDTDTLRRDNNNESLFSKLFGKWSKP